MKYLHGVSNHSALRSPSVWRVWIEMLEDISNEFEEMKSPSVWRVWIEIAIPEAPASLSPRHPPCGGCGLKYLKGGVYGKSHLSPSVWRVWIEISDWG